MDIPLVERDKGPSMAQSVTSPCINLYQFLLLIWKAFLLRKRHYIVTFFEAFFPILIASIPVIIYAEVMRSSSRYGYKSNPMTHGPQFRYRNATYYSAFDPRIKYSGSYSSPIHIVFSPNTSLSSSLTKEAMAYWTEGSNVTYASVTGVKTESDLEDEALKIQINNKNWDVEVIGIVYSNLPAEGGSLPESLNYKIRYGKNSMNQFYTKDKYPPFRIGPSYGNGYKYSRFLGVQVSVDHAFISRRTKDTSKKVKPQVMMQEIPYPPYDDQNSQFSLIEASGMCLCFSFLVFNMIIVKRVIDEKANRSKELMKMMGMSDCVYWTSTFISFFIMSFIFCLFMTMLYKVSFYGGDPFAAKTEFFLLLLLLLMISANTILFCLTITTLFNRPVMGTVVMIILWTVSTSLFSVYLFILGQYFYNNLSSRLAVCLLPTGAAMVIFKFISVMEIRGDGVQWSNLSNFSVASDQNLLMVMAILAVSCAMYCFLIWYIDAVCPWQYGVPRPFYFPFTKSYWFGRRNKVNEQTTLNRTGEYFEGVPSGTSPGIVIDQLTKEFRTGMTTKVAVDNLSMEIYDGQITALLGHNGAGKTTTINVLTGLYPPTKGTASIDGWDILTQINSARRSLGICPQHNVLYDTLTVEEHLKFYAGLKGVSWRETHGEVWKMLSLLKLEDKANELSKTLSGGMKRKLSLGIAMIGNSKVVFLDEPTSGMDPEARRSVWDMLISIRRERTIVLTTHYMEEADILGDRIAIIAEGTLQCYGSPLFLKQKFGTGYHLHLAKEPECDLGQVTTFLKNYVPEAKLESSAEREATYSFLESDPSQYGKMFEELEKYKLEMGIGSFGVSVTTMEDVFIKVTTNADDLVIKKEKREAGHQNLDEVFLVENGLSREHSFDNVFCKFQKLTGFALLQQQITGLLLKGLNHSKRHWSSFIVKLIFPFCLNLLMLWVIQTVLIPAVEKPLVLDLKSVYGESQGFYHFGKPEAEDFAEKFLKPVLTSSGVGAVKVDDPQSYAIRFGENNLLKYMNELIIGGSASFPNGALSVTAWYNGIPYHSSPMTLNVMDTALLRYLSGSNSASIKVTNAPLPFNVVPNRESFNFPKLIAAAFLPMSLAFMSSSFVFVPIYENASKAKLLQLMTGVSAFTYWLVMFVWDFLLYFACCIVLLIPFGIFNGYAFFGHSEHIGTVFLMFLLYGWGTIPLTYLASLIFKKPSTGFGVLVAVKLIVALTFAMVFAAIGVNEKVDKALWFLRLLPTFAATWGLGNVFQVSISNSFCDNIPANVLKYSCPTLNKGDAIFKCCSDYCGSDCFKKTYPLTWDSAGCGREALFLFLDGILYFVILFLIEMPHMLYLLRRIWRNYFPKNNIVSVQPNMSFNFRDADVMSEEDRVSQGNTAFINNEALLVLGLTKYYKHLCAVDHLKFGVHFEECFGLLGVNGAGKTSTFKMLTGDIVPSEGNAFLRDSSLLDCSKKFQEYLGYCPQYDALIDRLNGREMLTLFARLRGIPKNLIHPCVSELINLVDLQDHSEKPTSVYSGGNKRKLSLALALIGNPPLILLDEPTSGVDPVARRKIWNVLSQVRTVSGSSIILTTHSMEESEALCSRLAIMVNGQFRCLGSIQHLKSKFGQGYSIISKVKKEKLLTDPLMINTKQSIQNAFPSASLKDDHQGMLHYHVSDPSVTWSQLFNRMEELKKILDLDDYQISDTTLEQIFLSFARSQRITSEGVV